MELVLVGYDLEQPPVEVLKVGARSVSKILSAGSDSW